MLPSGKFIDDQSTSILQDIREKEKLVNEKGTVSFDDQLKAPRRNILPPLTLRQTSEVKRGNRENLEANLNRQRHPNLVLQRRESPDESVRLSRNTDAMSYDRTYDMKSIETRKLSHKASFERPYTLSDEKYLFNRSIENVTSRDREPQSNSSCSSKFSDSEEFGKSNPRNDFDAYLKHALRKREEDRLFMKKVSKTTIECVPDGRKKERPKTAHYGRRRTQFDTGNL